MQRGGCGRGGGQQGGTRPRVTLRPLPSAKGHCPQGWLKAACPQSPVLFPWASWACPLLMGPHCGRGLPAWDGQAVPDPSTDSAPATARPPAPLWLPSGAVVSRGASLLGSWPPSRAGRVSLSSSAAHRLLPGGGPCPCRTAGGHGAPGVSRAGCKPPPWAWGPRAKPHKPQPRSKSTL